MPSFDDENMEAQERNQLQQACSAADEAFGAAFDQWRQRVEAGELAADVDTWPILVSVPDTVVIKDKCESYRAQFADAGKQAALSNQRRGRDAYLELSDDPDELFGRELYFWYVRFRE